MQGILIISSSFVVYLWFVHVVIINLFLQIVDAIISHGCFLHECNVQHSIVGIRSRLETGVELEVSYIFCSKACLVNLEPAFLPTSGVNADYIWWCIKYFLFQDTMMMGADYYQTESEIASLLAEEKVPIGVGRNTKIRWNTWTMPLHSEKTS